MATTARSPRPRRWCWACQMRLPWRPALTASTPALARSPSPGLHPRPTPSLAPSEQHGAVWAASSVTHASGQTCTPCGAGTWLPALPALPAHRVNASCAHDTLPHPHHLPARYTLNLYRPSNEAAPVFSTALSAAGSTTAGVTTFTQEVQVPAGPYRLEITTANVHGDGGKTALSDTFTVGEGAGRGWAAQAAKLQAACWCCTGVWHSTCLPAHRCLAHSQVCPLVLPSSAALAAPVARL